MRLFPLLDSIRENYMRYYERKNLAQLVERQT